jgi:hypothetical protein
MLFILCNTKNAMDVLMKLAYECERCNHCMHKHFKPFLFWDILVIVDSQCYHCKEEPKTKSE